MAALDEEGPVYDPRTGQPMVVPSPAYPDRITPQSLADNAAQAWRAAQLPPARPGQEPPSRMTTVPTDTEERAVPRPPVDQITPSALGQMATGAVGALQGAIPPAGPGRPLSSVPGGVGYADINPPEAPSPRPGESATEEYLRRTGAASASEATRAILKADRDKGEAPTVEGQQPGAFGRGARAVTQAVTDIASRSLEPPRDREPGARPYKGTTPPAEVVQSTSPAAATEPTKEPPKTVDLKQPIRPKGAAGSHAPAMGGRKGEDLPDAIDKAVISPTFLVQLEKSDPALHDGIIRAATAAGIGSWDYANLIYAASKGNPNYNQDGRVGYAGLTAADVEKYKQQRPELFTDSQGNPVTAQDPSTNLMLGALKYRELRDMYGAKTPSSILAYALGADKVNAISRLSEGPERDGFIAPKDRAFVQQGAHGVDAGKPYVTPVPMTITDQGTATPSGTAQVMQEAARTGNVMPVISYAANNLPRRMGGNDAWRYLENQIVSTFIGKGDMVGAQHARELVFQMSHVGSNQMLMGAYKSMKLGDMTGAAQQLGLAYWSAPDGGLAQFAVVKGKDGKQAIIGQRYNDDTRQPVGDTFQVTEEGLMGLMNVTRDVQGFAKTLRENQKLHAEIADKHADTLLKLNHAQYWKDLLPSIERRNKETQENASLRSMVQLLKGGPGGAAGGKPDPRFAHVDEELAKWYGIAKDPITGAAMEIPADIAPEYSFAKSLRVNNDWMATPDAVAIAKDFTKNPQGTKYLIAPNKNPDKAGWGVIYDRKTNSPIGQLHPYTMQRIGAAPAAAAAAPAPKGPSTGSAPVSPRPPPAPGMARAPAAAGY